MRKQIAAANWKMNLSLLQAEELVNALLQTDHSLNDNQATIYIRLTKDLRRVRCFHAASIKDRH